ncbi:MAG: enoyl-CoA hydratase/isomerase family protein [Acidobacteriota bacterium]
MIHRDDRDGIAVLTLDHGKANAVDIELFEALGEHLDNLETDDARAVVLTGAGSSFSAGVDLFRVLDGGADYLDHFLGALSSTVERLFAFHKPVVAAVNGHAIAGGCILALACDRRVATNAKAKLGVSELKVGVPFPVAPLEILRYHLPNAVVQDLVLTGRLLDPDEALALGLVEELAEPDAVLDRALRIAGSLARIPDGTFALTKHQLRQDALEAIRRHSSELDGEILRQWSEPATLDVIRGFVEATVGKNTRGDRS